MTDPAFAIRGPRIQSGNEGSSVPAVRQRVTVTAQFCESEPTLTVTVAVPSPTAVIWICEP